MCACVMCDKDIYGANLARNVCTLVLDSNALFNTEWHNRRVALLYIRHTITYTIVLAYLKAMQQC